jgi:hypothetical protein
MIVNYIYMQCDEVVTTGTNWLRNDNLEKKNSIQRRKIISREKWKLAMAMAKSRSTVDLL